MKIKEPLKKLGRFLVRPVGLGEAIRTQKAIWTPLSSMTKGIWTAIRGIRIRPLLEGFKKGSAPPLEKGELFSHVVSGLVMYGFGIWGLIFVNSGTGLFSGILFISVGSLILISAYRRYRQIQNWRKEAWEHFKKSNNYKDSR